MANLRFKKLINFDFKKHSEELFEKVEMQKIKKRGEISTEGAFIGIIDLFKNEKFIYFKAYKEFQREANYFDGDPKNLKRVTNIDGRCNAILLTSDGYVLHEISSFFHDQDIKELILGLFKSVGLHKTHLRDIREFDLKTMRAFYKSAKRVINLTIKKIGEIDPNPRMPPEEIETRSEERRVGKECRSRWSPYH